MAAEKCEVLLLEILRIGLIMSRLLAAIEKPDVETLVRLKEWTELCHTLPSVLLGKCDVRAVRYFVTVNAARFVARYPAKDDVHFLQFVTLKAELEAILADAQ